MNNPEPQEQPSPHDLPTLIQEGQAGGGGPSAGEAESRPLEDTPDSGSQVTHGAASAPVGGVCPPPDESRGGQPAEGRHTLAMPPVGASTTTPVTPLSRVGDYELLAEIGRGGMGVVFRARDVRLGRIVALKMLSSGVVTGPEDLHRFATEAAAAAQLQHPNIVALYDVGAFDGQPYFSMEYVAGQNLAQRVSLGVLPGRLAASYIERLARAVHFAHSKGIIHRDLKPANVLIDEQDQPKITDFGLAKLLRSDSGQTRTGTVVGTPSYMAPEQANARKDLGPACDIYSLGAILYELITGHPPFLGETALATMHMVANQDPVPPHLVNPGVDRELETICLKCLEKEPSRRYGSAEALADDLRRYLRGEPIAARRVGPVGRLVKWARRKPAVAALLAVILFGLGAFGVFGWQNAVTEHELRLAAEQERIKVEQREQILRHFFYLGQMQQAHHAWEDADLRRAVRLLMRWTPREGQTDLRGWEWHYLNRLCGGNRTLAAHPERVTSVAYSPDGRLLATAGGHAARPGDVKIWDVATGRLLHVLPRRHTNLITKVAFSPDGTLLATASADRTIRIWSATGGGEVAVLVGHTAHVSSVAFSPDGKRLASAGGDRTVKLWDLTRRESVCLHTGREHSGEVTCVAFSPLGDLIASGSLDETVRLWDGKTGRPAGVLRGHRGEVMSLAFSPSGKVLVSGGGPGLRQGEVKIWDMAGRTALETHYGLSDRILCVDINRRGGIAAAGSDGMVQVWDESRSSEAIRFRADTQLVLTLTFRPDGEHLATGGTDGRVRIWNSSGGQETYRLHGQPRVEDIVYSPTGKYFATAGRAPGRDGTVILWDADTRQPVHTFRGHAGQVNAVAFSSDGKRLVSGGDDRTVRIFDVETKDALHVLKGHTGRVIAVAFHPNGKLIASGGDDDLIRLWEATTGKQSGELTGDYNSVLTLAFDPKGRYLASGGYDRAVRLWHLERKTSVKLEGHSGSVNAVVFSATGEQVASGSTDQTVRIWDVSTGKEFLRLEGATRAITALAYHPSGARLASVGADRSVRLWDLVTRQEILQLGGPEGTLRAVAFSPDGWRLMAAGEYTDIYLWDAVPLGKRE